MAGEKPADPGGIPQAALGERPGEIIHARLGRYGLGMAEQEKLAFWHGGSIGWAETLILPR
jgi:hypothetical protein